MNKFVKFVIAAAAALACGSALANDIKANTPYSAYVQDGRGVIARNATGLCWRTGYWTPADAVGGCDKPLVPTCKANEELVDNKCVPKKVVCGANQRLEGDKCVDIPAPPVQVTCAPNEVLREGKCVKVGPISTKVSFNADALFDFDKAVLKKEGKEKLDDLTSKLQGVDLEVVIAVGHTDSVGSDAYNQKLSLRRAEAVKAYLKGKGLDEKRIYTEGKGEKSPVADNKTADGRAKNRRVEIEVVGVKKN
ncbi:OmpA family protein [Massilia sp. W12]|uniref:OmpA family protein n=1 Tax=Massilia sp. W12 TaxID=3126507 RepID=UPI0030D477D1